MNILITGKNGQVATELRKYLAELGTITAWGRAELDLTQPEAVRERIRELRPDLIVNAAAYTAVDKAEDDADAAMLLNARAPQILAEEAKALDIPLIHYSTDYVFDGKKDSPYTEDDLPKPLNVYGRSKLDGENAIRAVGGKYLILRTTWVYALHGTNFLRTMERLLQERDELRIVADQIGAPTWAGTIAVATRELIKHWRDGQAGAWGLYNLTAQGETSWFGFASAIGAHLLATGRKCAELQPIHAVDYPTPAIRPLNSRLDCSRLQREWHIQLPNWKDAMFDCVAPEA